MEISEKALVQDNKRWVAICMPIQLIVFADTVDDVASLRRSGHHRLHSYLKEMIELIETSTS